MGNRDCNKPSKLGGLPSTDGRAHRVETDGGGEAGTSKLRCEEASRSETSRTETGVAAWRRRAGRKAMGRGGEATNKGRSESMDNRRKGCNLGEQIMTGQEQRERPGL
ncbi:hypothetical protein PIB30_006580 [Stylosanthes scabra]|uniref:Uncharacterized protein n=1 Tax=Stylosanthes scabra TaxID=79078 RepID=A0ABU6Y4G5_9FABA|nr:hypothetical protein [Stylosanthes scabra]